MKRIFRKKRMEKKQKETKEIVEIVKQCVEHEKFKDIFHEIIKDYLYQNLTIEFNTTEEYIDVIINLGETLIEVKRLYTNKEE